MSDLRIPLDYKEKQLPRAAWNLSQPAITTFMQCLNIPLKFEILKPKDDVDVKYEYVLQSLPMVGQLLNNWKLRILTFKSSLSNYYGWMDNNKKQDASQWKGKRHHFISPTTVSQNVVPVIMSQFHYDNTWIPNDTTFNWFATRFLSVVPSFIVSYAFSGVDESAWQEDSPTWQSVTYSASRDISVQSDSLLDMIGLPSGFISSRKLYASSEFNSDVYVASGSLYVTPYSNKDCFNADFILAYLDSVRTYLVNNQYSFVPYFYNAPKLTIDPLESNAVLKYKCEFVPKINQLPLSSIDDFIMSLRMCSNGVDIFAHAVENGNVDIATWLCSLRLGGHFLAQYERDMLTSLMYNTSSSEVTISVDDSGNFSINQLRFANRYQLLQDRADVAGGRYRDRLRTIWGSDDRSGLDVPELVGVSSYVINPRMVVSTADTYNTETGEGNSAGQLNGVVNTDAENKYQHSIYSPDDSILFFVAQLVPDVVYSNGLGKGLDINMFDDEYTPQFDQLGFQDVPMYKYNCLPSYHPDSGVFDYTNTDLNRVVGKNLAFIDLISNVGRVHGKFSNNEYFETWVLKRTFDENIDVNIYDDNGEPTQVVVGRPVRGISPYANPLDYQYPFVATGSTDPNFVASFGFDIRAVRSKGKSYMPTLGR